MADATDTTIILRRGFLSRLIALPLLGAGSPFVSLGDAAAGAVATIAPANSNAAPAADLVDADLIDAAVKWRAAFSQFKEADKACVSAEDATIWPEPPEALFERRGDGVIALVAEHFGRPAPDDWQRYFHAAPSLARAEPSGTIDYYAGGRCFETRLTPRLKKRISEIVAAARSHGPAREAAAQASGLTAARARRNAAETAKGALYEEITRTQALTLEGAVAKAAVTAEMFGGADKLWVWASRAPPSGPLGAAISIMIDLAYLAEAGWGPEATNS